MKSNAFVYFIFFILSKFLYANIYDLTNYTYPNPIDDDTRYNIVILSTSDIHGAFFPTYVHLDNLEYKSGGLTYMASLITILRKMWSDRLLWLDGGDQFQGGLETSLSNGSLMTDFFNIMQLNAATIGNHEWDFGQDYLITLMNNAQYDFIVSNIHNTSSNKDEFLPNQVKYKIYQVGKIKVGVIGATTITTNETSSGNLSNIEIDDYEETISTASNALKEGNADVIVLLIHAGIECASHSEEEKYTLKMRNKATPSSNCSSTDELEKILAHFEGRNLFDVVLSSHCHDIVHKWIHGYPVIQTKSNGKYFNLMYLNFKKNKDGSFEFLPDDVELEGPVPVCEKVWSNKLQRCEIMWSITDAGKLLTPLFHGEEVKEDAKLDELSKKWWDVYNGYKNKVITYTDAPLSVNEEEENALGNLFADFLMKVTGADFAIFNKGGLRADWPIGKISVASVYNMCPFENEVASFVMTGKEAKRMLKEIQGGRYSPYQTTGLKQSLLNTEPKELISVVLFDGLREREIKDDENYTIATTSFLINGGDDFRKVREWYNKPYKIHDDFRQQLIKYLKSFDKIRLKDLIDKNNPRLKYINP